jgi:transcriptional regulator with XRE-family HTH domain
MGILRNDEGCIARRLREARMGAGISQKALGELAGIDPDSSSARINQYEAGKHTPHFKIIKQLAEALKVPASFFYEEDDEIARLLLKLHQLPPSRRKMVVAEITETLGR